MSPGCVGDKRPPPFGGSPPLTRILPADLKKPVGKTKEELTLEKKRELERRLQDVSGQLNSAKKPPKKGQLASGRRRGLSGGPGHLRLTPLSLSPPHSQ